jgi:hypothetical protein
LTWSQRITIWWTFWYIFVRSPVSAPLCWPPSFRSVLLWSAVWRSTSLNSNRFPVLGCGGCGGWRVHSRAWSLVLSKWTIRRRTDLGKFPKPTDSIVRWYIIHTTPFMYRDLHIYCIPCQSIVID